MEIEPSTTSVGISSLREDKEWREETTHQIGTSDDDASISAIITPVSYVAEGVDHTGISNSTHIIGSRYPKVVRTTCRI